VLRRDDLTGRLSNRLSASAGRLMPRLDQTGHRNLFHAWPSGTAQSMGAAESCRHPRLPCANAFGPAPFIWAHLRPIDPGEARAYRAATASVADRNNGTPEDAAGATRRADARSVRDPWIPGRFWQILITSTDIPTGPNPSVPGAPGGECLKNDG